MKIVRSKPFIITMYLVVTILYTLPLIISGPKLGYNEDLPFHITRLFGLSNFLSSPVNFTNFSNSGYGVNFFYPWVTFTPAVLFYKISHSILSAYVGFILFINFITLLFSYAAVKRYTGSVRQAVLFSLLYLFNPYHNLNVFLRADIGEIVSLAFVPFVIFGLLGVLQQFDKNWGMLSIGMIFIGFSHLLSLMLFTMLCFIITIVYFIFHNDNVWAKVILLIKAGIAAILALSFYWMPMIQQLWHTKIAEPHYYDLFASSTGVSNVILNSLDNNYYSIGIISLICLIYVGLNWSKFSFDYRLSFMIVVVSMFFLTTLFPSYIFNHTFMKTIQFVWRFYEIAFGFSVFLASKVILSLFNNYSKVINSALFIATLLGCLVLMNFASYDTTLKNTSILNKSNVYKVISQTSNTDYVPKQSKIVTSGVSNHLFLIDGKKEKLKFRVTSNSFKLNYKNYGENKTLVLPVYAYAGVKVDNNGTAQKPLITSQGLVGVNLHQGYNQIKIYYTYTKIAILGLLISVIALICTLYRCVVTIKD